MSVQRTGLADPLLWEHAGMHSMRVLWPLLQSQTTQSLLESQTLAPSRGARCRLRLCTARFPLCRGKLSHPGLRGTYQESPIEKKKKKESPIGDAAGPAWGRGLSTSSQVQTVASEGLTP